MTRVITLFAAVAFLGMLTVTAHVAADEYHLSIPFSDLTPGQKYAAKRASRTQPIQPLVACVDPSNMPLSSLKEEGFQNRILELLAGKMDTTMSFHWLISNHRALMNSLFHYQTCNLLPGTAFGSKRLLQTLPIYRSTYVFVYRKNSGIHIDGFDDPDLTTHSLGVFEPSAMRQVLAKHGIKDVQVMYGLKKEPWRLAWKVAQGKLDIAAVWGPFAGYAQAKSGVDLVLQPANLMSDKIPMQYTMAFGMLPGAVVLKYALDYTLKHSANQIKQILVDYNVPLVRCSECIVSGDIPAHGAYTESLYESLQARFMQPSDERQTNFDPAVARKRIEAAIERGRTPTEQLFNALASSEDRLVAFLVNEYGADPNAISAMGSLPLGIAASYRDSHMIETLLSVGAKPNRRDQHGFTPLIYAAHRNHAPSIKMLIKAGANPDMRGPHSMTPLGIATGERNFFAARALLKAGADVNAWTHDTHLTPLMLVASKSKSESRHAAIAGGMAPVDLARLMIEQYGAEVRAESTAGNTALMAAAAQNNAAMIGLLVQHGADISATNDAGKTALEIARELGSDAASQALVLFKQMMPAEPTQAKGDVS